MKKILLAAIVILFAQCTAVNSVIPTSTTSYQTRNDFKSVSESTKDKFLVQKNATSVSKSVLILTQGFKGEKIKVQQNGKTIYSEYPISHIKTKYADSFTFDNSADLLVIDNFSKEEITIDSKKINGHKFVYLMKYLDGEKTKYKITLSDKLRPLQ